MNISNFLSVKDFFNYYVAGLLWLLDLMLIWIPKDTYENALAWLKKFQNTTEVAGVLSVGLFILIPYVIGFTLTPLSEQATRLLRRIFDDPKDWITDYSEKTETGTFRHIGKRLAQTKIRLIIKRLKDVFGNEKTINNNNLKNWFSPIRAYVINSQGEAASFAIRAQDLANFTESILLPFPLLFVIVGVKIVSGLPVLGFVLFILGALSLWSLSYRYNKLRFYWVKHVYNTFLAVTSDKSQTPN